MADDLEISSLDYYRLVRSQLEHEDDLISTRLSWFIASQSFLFTAYAIIANGIVGTTVSSDPRHLLLLIIPGISGATCLLMFVAILSGVAALSNLRRIYRESPRKPVDASLPPIHGTLGTRVWGLAAPIFLPAIFLAVWIFLFLRRLF